MTTSFYFTLADPWHDPGGLWLSSSGGEGYGKGAGCMAGAGPGFR